MNAYHCGPHGLHGRRSADELLKRQVLLEHLVLLIDGILFIDHIGGGKGE